MEMIAVGCTLCFVFFPLVFPVYWFYCANRMPWEPTVVPDTRWNVCGIGPVTVDSITNSRLSDYKNFTVMWKTCHGKINSLPIREFTRVATQLTDDEWSEAVEKAKILRELS